MDISLKSGTRCIFALRVLLFRRSFLLIVLRCQYRRHARQQCNQRDKKLCPHHSLFLSRPSELWPSMQRHNATILKARNSSLCRCPAAFWSPPEHLISHDLPIPFRILLSSYESSSCSYHS